jgi:hypothetical protein
MTTRPPASRRADQHEADALKALADESEAKFDNDAFRALALANAHAMLAISARLAVLASAVRR